MMGQRFYTMAEEVNPPKYEISRIKVIWSGGNVLSSNLRFRRCWI